MGSYALSTMFEILLLLIGIPIGVLGSLLAWWILFHRIVSNIQFSPHISKTRTNDTRSGYRYRVKFENAGRRSILDVEIFAKLRIKGLRDGYPTNWETIYIPIRVDRRPLIKPSRTTRLREIVRFYVNDIEAEKLVNFSECVRRRRAEGCLLLEDLLGVGTQSELQIITFGYDEFSGSRKVFPSKKYLLDDIKYGQFDTKCLRILEGIDGNEVLETKKAAD